MQKRTNRRRVFDLGTRGFNGCLDFGHYHYTEVEPVLESHAHEGALEICFCLKGQQYYQVGKDLLKLTGNSIAIIPPNTDHSSGVYPEDIGELFWLQISLQEGGGNLCHLPNDQSTYLLSELEKMGNSLFKGAFGLKNILEGMVALLELPETTFNRIYLDHLIVRLLLETLSLGRQSQTMVASERMDIITGYIDNNLYRTIAIEELADLLHVSPVYFKSWFKQSFGIPPRSYINRLKIEKAKEELLFNKTVTDVAFGLGFSSSQYFATVFRKHTGRSPRAYIASLR
ncbi:MAG: helix-turn-helix domain-containing protein [Flavobacteriaceae bacterium]